MERKYTDVMQVKVPNMPLQEKPEVPKRLRPLPQGYAQHFSSPVKPEEKPVQVQDIGPKKYKPPQKYPNARPGGSRDNASTRTSKKCVATEPFYMAHEVEKFIRITANDGRYAESSAWEGYLKAIRAGNFDAETPNAAAYAKDRPDKPYKRPGMYQGVRI